MSVTPALELSGINKSFGSKTVLKDVSMRVGQNEVVGLIGENGAGKSTLLKLLAGLHQQDSGGLRIHGIDRELRNASHAAELGIGVVHQEQSLLTNLSVAENIHLGGAKNRNKDVGSSLGFLNWKTINAQATKSLRRIGLDMDPRAMIADLTFAQRQMVEIAKAVEVGEHAHALPIVILDEPTSVLEPAEIKRLSGEIQRLREIGSVIFVSHRLEEVLEFTDRIYVLRHGKVVAERETKNVDEEELFALMTGRQSVRVREDLQDFAEADTVLEVKNLSTAGGLDEITLTLKAGQLHSLVGATSSGCEEVVRAIFGVERVTSGSIKVAGHPVDKLTVRERIRRGMAYLPSERKAEGIVSGMSVTENIALAHLDATHGRGLRRRNLEEQLSNMWMDRLDIRPWDGQAAIAELSGGNQQKVALAKWLCDPNLKLLLLDRPFRGLDPGAIESVKEAVRQACHGGVAVLTIADTLEEALELADDITVLKDGAVTASINVLAERPSVVDILGKMV